MTNRNYTAPYVDFHWAYNRETSLPVAIAIHAIADSTRTAQEIWEAPTSAEMDHVRMAVAEYIEHGDFDPEEQYFWGQETFVL